MTALIATVAGGYLLGSVPFGYLLVRVFRGQDIRLTGSGNIGATNVSRTSPVLGFVTLLLDALKGFAAVGFAHALFPGQNILLGVAGLAAVAGHMFPIWLRFRGGKGVATALGSLVAFAPKTTLALIGVFAVTLLLFRYVSLASIVAAASFPALGSVIEPRGGKAPLLAFSAAAGLIIARHYQNIGRLINHTEPRFQWRRR